MEHHKSITKTIAASIGSHGEFTLHVNNLPGELNEHGLLQVFERYGNVIGHFYISNATWAYITYGTYNEAESAIKDLHNVPPLRLKVSFAKERSSYEIHLAKIPASNNIEQYEENNVIDAVHRDKLLMQTRGRGRPLDVFKKVEPNAGLPKYTYTSDDDLLYPYPSDLQTYNPYENAEPYENTNTLWTRGQLTITHNGKRHVSFGRGYTMYEIPEPNPEIQNHISKVYEKRTSGLYEYGKDMLQSAVGKCQKCSKITKFTCARCCSFYCSRNCQVADWPQHKIECQAIPALVTVVNSMHLPQPHNKEEVPIRNPSNIQMPLRPPKKLMNAEASLSQRINVSKNQDITDIENRSNFHPKEISISDKLDVDNKHTIQLKKTEEQNNFAFKKLPEIGSNDTEDSDLCFDKVTDSRKSNSHENTIKKRQNFNIEDVRKMEEDIAFCKHTFLSKYKFTDVRITVKLGCECWVQKVEDSKSIEKLMTDLHYEAEKAQKVKPIVGNIYAVKYETIWHRALVTCLNPLTVHYIDYGNDEIIDSHDFRKITRFKDIPRFCAKIRLSEEANEKLKNFKYEDIITVKMISVDSNKVINVEIQGENDVSKSQIVNLIRDVPIDSNDNKTVASLKVSGNDKLTSSMSKLKNVIDTVSDGERGILEVHAKMKNNMYSITLLPDSAFEDFQKVFVTLSLECEKMIEKHSNHKPQIMDIICGRTPNGHWRRGYILLPDSPLKMVIIDEARMMTITETMPCFENFLNICAFGATCELIDAKSDVELAAMEHCEFTVVTCSFQNKIEIEISRDQCKLRAIVKPWTPMPEQKGLEYAKLKSECEVCLTAYRSHIHLFARSLEKSELEYFHRIMQNVAKCAQTASVLKEPPVVGQMVIAQYIDDNHYRAIVTKVQGDKITVSYIDFGNTEVTNIKKLKIITDDLKQPRSCTSKIRLKDVPQDVPMTKEVSDYLSKLVGTEVPLKCTFEGIPSESGVHLKLHNGENVNKIISEMLVPIWNKTDEEDKTCYMMQDLDVASLGKVGDIVKAIVLYSIEDGYKYAMCPLDYDLMTHVCDIMLKAMTEYCERTEYYIPRERELCLALYDNGWYRAACICRSETPTTSLIFFVDFGNVSSVSHKDIRAMPKDFITPNALASICQIVNMAPVQDNGLYSSEIEKRITQLIVPNNSIEIKIIECDEASGVYSVEIPMVQTKLIEEGLISS